jgi:hypothetical protein
MAWELTGNDGVDPSKNFLGTINNAPLIISAGDTEALRVQVDDGFRGNVGIGAADPTHSRLLIAADAAVTDILMLRNTNAHAPRSFRIGPGLGHIDQFQIFDDEAGQTRLAIDLAGRILLGTVPLEVPDPNRPGFSTDAGQVMVCSDSSSPSGSGRGGLWVRGSLSFTTDVNSNTGEFVGSDRAGTKGNALGLDFFTAFAPRLSITNGGNVGIGTQTPQALLDVVGDVLVDGNVRVTQDVLLVNADCAEDFDAVEVDSIDPGTVVVLDSAGLLCPCSSAYDTRVAGVVSGAGDLRPAIRLNYQSDSSANRRPVALLGRVMCKADAAVGPITVGDLLTTSDRPGYAMKAKDPHRAFGSILGKAVAPLAKGRGLIPILVALQ